MNPKKRLLLVEDDENLGATIAENLQLDGFHIYWIKTGEEALKELAEKEYDLILLDRMLPGLQGLDVLKQVRMKSNMPVLMISAKGNAQDRIEGLEALVDDYLPKPFHFKELRLRIEALLRRTHDTLPITTNSLELSGAVFDFQTYEIRFKDKVSAEKFTQKEVLFLQALKKANGSVVNREDLVTLLWKDDENANTRTIDNLMVKFRKWVSDDPIKPRHFVSHRGIGYSLRINL